MAIRVMIVGTPNVVRDINAEVVVTQLDMELVRSAERNQSGPRGARAVSSGLYVVQRSISAAAGRYLVCGASAAHRP
jgi:hypothetical protein